MVHVADKRDGLPGQTAIVWERCVATRARHVLTPRVCYPFGYDLHYKYFDKLPDEI